MNKGLFFFLLLFPLFFFACKPGSESAPHPNSGGSVAESSDNTMPEGNRLALEKSPYLKSAAHQPVDWYPWGEEAFAAALAQDKPVLLDIGAVWCHWCHVIDRESYENEEIAALINEYFIAVKVDRDERPDIDMRYQKAIQRISGSGGWPLTAFLTPEGKVFYGGTYFPPEDKYGRPGMKTLLAQMAKLYQEDRQRILDNADKLFAEISAEFTPLPGELFSAQVEKALEHAARSFDSVHGGFKGAPKFPNSGAVDLWLKRAAEHDDADSLKMALATLRKMAEGGVYDHVGGGFHRYSTDERWLVPHFEKMSYDNSELLRNFAYAYALTGEVFFRDVALDIVRFETEVLSDQKRGGFYASQDADISLDDDGDFFTWSLDETAAVLEGKELEFALLFYGISAQGEMHHNPAKNVLHAAMPLSEAAKQAGVEGDARVFLSKLKKKLKAVRDTRQAPFVDPSLYTNWNAMMVSAYFDASGALGNEAMEAFALKTLERFLDEAYDSKRGFVHLLGKDPKKDPGYLNDQAAMLRALLSAHEATQEARYLKIAQELAKQVNRRYWDHSGSGGYMDIPTHDPSDGSERMEIFSIPRKSIGDNPSPSGNAVMALSLQALWRLTGDESFREQAKKTLEYFSAECARYGPGAATYFLALDVFLSPPPSVVVVGPKGDKKADELFNASRAAFRYGKTVRRLTPGDVKRTYVPDYMKAMLSGADKAEAYVCGATSCAPPTDDVAVLQKTIRTFK